MTCFDKARAARSWFAAALCAGMLTLLPLTGAAAQEKPAAPPPAPGGGTPGPGTPSVVTSPTYVILPEDVLAITVVDRPELGRTVQVLPDGMIDMPDVGQVKASGKTIDALKKELQTKLARKYTRPQVNIAVTARQIRQVNIFGAVANRGKVPLRDGWRVRDVLAASGGLASTVYPADRYEFFRAELNQARGGATLPIDLGRLLGQGDDTQNYPVEPDDTITVREVDIAEANVSVVGAVQRPGPQLTPRSGSIVDVIVAAGPIPELAQLSEVEIQSRTGAKTKVDLRGFSKPGFTTTVRINPGDRITVPENKNRYYLLGNFSRPGEQVYPDDQKLTVFTVVGKSGLTRGAELKKTKLIRPTPSGKAQEFVVDVERMIKTGDLSKDQEVKPGDSIFIPDSPRNAWDRLWPVVQVLSIGLGLYLTIKAL
jgi:polysaccharide biosynthesis/export protein